VVGRVDLKKAKEKAGEITLGAATGADPLAEISANKGKTTFGEWADTYLKSAELSKRSWKEDVRYLAIAKEAWAGKTLDSITREMVSTLHRELAADGEHNARANRWLASVSKCFTEAIDLGKLSSNPAARVKKLPENPARRRVFTDDELSRFMNTIDKYPDPFVRLAFRLMLETGARVGEVLSAKWSDIDLDEGVWVLPKAKGSRGYKPKAQFIGLAPETVEMLREAPRMVDSEYVIPGRSGGMRNDHLKKPWNRIREEAQLGDIHIHDIRRTFGAKATKLFGLFAASKMLRHSDIRVTEEVYAPFEHVFDDRRATWGGVAASMKNAASSAAEKNGSGND
jgi:integrase